MRFLANGPVIPDHLLEKRDEGNCVFICGAGVSLPSGMPTFVDLTQYVIDNLHVLPEDPISQSFEPWREGALGPKTPLDQIFHDLYQEYGKEQINQLVTDRLKQDPATTVPSSVHSIVERLSCGLDGKTQIITTNFDRLFQSGKCGEFPIHRPPRLPAVEHGDDIIGVTYLHGCVPEGNKDPQDYVLGSADFGKAYLAEGWATSFIKQVIQRYTVVLLGYTAEDPPVKYLLQGLKDIDGANSSTIYAFEEGEQEDIEAKWRERGVTPIAYPQIDRQHSSLWKTLEAWAERADDPAKWREKIILKAVEGPRALKPYERGQVAHIVRSVSGARAFAEKKPIITPEWLCVFDAGCRAAPKYQDYLGKVEEFEPLEQYGLDDDPARSSDKGDRKDQTYDNIFHRKEADILADEVCHLTGFKARLPTRLSYLQSWILENLDSPTVAWWVCRHYFFHPSFMTRLDWELSHRKSLPSQAVSIWRKIEQVFANILSPDPDLDGRFFDIKKRIENEGWSQNVLLGLEKALSARLTVHRPSGICSVKPPSVEWEDIHISQIADFNVAFCDLHGEKFDVPDDHLEDVLKIAEAQLLRAVALLGELPGTYLSVPSCYPEQTTENDSVDYLDANDRYFLWFLGLLKRAIEICPDFVRKRVLSWPQNEKYFFNKLLIFAYAQPSLFTASDTAIFLSKLHQSIFWDREILPELLYLIRDRWEDFSLTERDTLAERILAGPVHQIDYGDDMLRLRAALYAKWLEMNGCTFSNTQSDSIQQLVRKIDGWSDGWVKDFARSNRSRAYRVKADDSPDELLSLPVSQIIDHLKTQVYTGRGGFNEKQPFSGLIKQKPKKALAALSFKLRENQCETLLWADLLEAWPEDAGVRETNLCAARLHRFAEENLCAVFPQIVRWMSQNWETIYRQNSAFAWAFYDQISSCFRLEVNDPLDRETISRSRFDYSSGPAGQMAGVLLNLMPSLATEASSSEEFLSRLEGLLSLKKSLAQQVATLLTRNVDWLHEKYPNWVFRVMVPWFDLKHPFAEAVWSALIRTRAIQKPALREEMKPSLLNAFPLVAKWSWSQSLLRLLVQRFIRLVVFSDENEQEKMAIDVRRNLIQMDDQGRSTAVQFLSSVGRDNDDGWRIFVIPFVQKYWPKNIKFRTEKTTNAWLYLLSNSGEKFPVVLSAVKGHLGSVRTGSALLNFTRSAKDEKSLAEMFPAEVLEMVQHVKPQQAGFGLYGLSELIDSLSAEKLEGDQLRILADLKENFASR
ncbi:SIR2 family protein [Thalassospira sp. MA62]|nr:SIR2 family protein [Thalassospira sp. MA62]